MRVRVLADFEAARARDRAVRADDGGEADRKRKATIEAAARVLTRQPPPKRVEAAPEQPPTPEPERKLPPALVRRLADLGATERAAAAARDPDPTAAARPESPPAPKPSGKRPRRKATRIPVAPRSARPPSPGTGKAKRRKRSADDAGAQRRAERASAEESHLAGVSSVLLWGTLVRRVCNACAPLIQRSRWASLKCLTVVDTCAAGVRQSSIESWRARNMVDVDEGRESLLYRRRQAACQSLAQSTTR